MEERAIQRGRTEAAFREVNERIAENARRFESGVTEFICECADVRCTDRIEVTLEEYERVRADGATFLLAPGHRDASLERVIAQRPRFHVVEKVHTGARALVRALNPRAAST
jgi:hypothetical protein